ncbi:MAG TPA: ligase [Bacteroidetes bacterium]|nr:ligase [Bacteroidota bacterium]
MKTRLVDCGIVPSLRSQTIYHAVAECTEPDGMPTITLMRPDKPYVCIGYHQEVEKEIDVSYCGANDIPVIRRQVGGGAVLLDVNQLFFHVIIPKDKAADFRLPSTLMERYAYLAKAPIAAYEPLGIRAQFRPINDIHVNGKKIGGTGTADVGGAFLFVGSMMLDFNHALMARVLKFSDEKMRDKVQKTMEDYVTSMRRELGAAPPIESVKKELVAAFAEVYQLDFVGSELSHQELQKVDELDRTFAGEAWLHAVQWNDTRSRSLTINADVKIVEGAHKAPGGLLRLTVKVVNNIIEDTLLSGDFTISPRGALKTFSMELIGCSLAPADLTARVHAGLETHKFDMPGVTAADFTQLISKIAHQE